MRLPGAFPAHGRFSDPGNGELGIEDLSSVIYLSLMAQTDELTLPGTIQEEATKSRAGHEPGYLVICWNDPVNLMTYVTHVFQTVFGWPRQKAEFHMLQVHEQGKSVLVRDSLEKAEHYVHQLQKYRLHATLEPDE
jgi:ATP-dependent Clp protease adaptor protein ClpS